MKRRGAVPLALGRVPDPHSPWGAGWSAVASLAVSEVGYPTAMETSGRDAVGAALAVVAATAELGATLDPGLGVSGLRARAGVDTGVVIVASSDAAGAERIPTCLGRSPTSLPGCRAPPRPVR